MIATDFAIVLVACIAGVILDPQARGTEEIALSWQHSIVILYKKKPILNGYLHHAVIVSKKTSAPCAQVGISRPK